MVTKADRVEQHYFTVYQASRYCGLTEAALRLRIQRGLPIERAGARIFIARETLDEMIRSNSLPTPQQDTVR